MNSEIKNKVIELVNENFDNLGIDELEEFDLSKSLMLDYIGDYIWEDFGFEIENCKNEIEDIVWDLREEKLKEKYESLDI